MLDLIRDVRLAARRLWRRPGLLLASGALLAVAVGGGTALFAVIDAVLLRALPLKEERALVALHIARPEVARGPLPLPLVLRLQSDAKSFAALSPYFQWSVNLTADADAERVQGMRVSGDYFATLGADVAMGRPLTVSDTGADSLPAAVISDGLWKRRFGAASDIVGRRVQMNGEPFVIAGVLRRNFPFQIRDAEVIAPWRPDTDARRTAPTLAFLAVTARLAPGVTLAAAQAEFDLRLEEYRTTYPQTRSAQQRARVVALREDLTGSPRSVLWLLSIGMFLVMAIAAANLGGLLLVESTHRRQEFATRHALGATSGRVRAQLAAEALVLAAGGLGLGILVARLLLSAVVLSGDAVFLSAVTVALDPTALLFALAAAASITVSAALFPWLALSRPSPSGQLGQRWSTPAARRIRTMLVTAEVGSSVLLLIVAGLLIRSFIAVQRVEVGFQPDGLLTVRLSLPRGQYPATAALTQFFERLAPRLQALPKVTNVAAANVVPMNGFLAAAGFRPPGFETEDDGAWPEAHYRMVSPEYFSVMGIPVIAGRAFDSTDRKGAVPVAIVTRALARRYWPADNPIGSQIVLRDDAGKVRPVQVVGVVGDVRHLGPEVDAPFEVYVPIPQVPDGTSVWLANNMYWIVKTSDQPLTLANAVRREVAAVDRNVASSFVRTMEQWVDLRTQPRRFNLRLMIAFGVAALLLTVIGVYAANAEAVTSREREIGVRAALGASDKQIRGLVLREGLVPVAVGVGSGALVAAAVSRLLATFLFGVAAADLVTFGAVSAATFVIGGIAVYLPIRVLTRIDPVIALRSE